MTQAQIAQMRAMQFAANQVPMHGIGEYSSPAQIAAAQARAAYFAQRPNYMRGGPNKFEDLPGALEDNITGQTLGDLGVGDFLDSKTLTYAGLGALAGYFLLGGKKTMNAGIGAAVGAVIAKVM